MSADDDLYREFVEHQAAKDRQPDPPGKHPTGWEPGMSWGGGAGTVTTQPHEGGATPAWDDILRVWGLDPDRVEVVPGTVQVRAWDANVGGGEIKRLFYYRCNVRERIPGLLDDEELTRLIAEFGGPGTVAPSAPPVASLVANWSDPQIGKADGDGVKGTIARTVDSIGRVQDVLRDHRRAGVDVDQLVLATVGDLVEGCDNFYPAQTWSVTLDRREQNRVVRRLLARAVRDLSPLVPRMLVCGVAGNHGEHRKAKSTPLTGPGDNDDVAVLEVLAEQFAMNDSYGHVAFAVPDDRLTLTLDVSGTVISWAHGHKFGRGTTPSKKAWDWWERQAAKLPRRPIADATVLVSGHFHHFCSKQDGGRTWLQCPAMDGGSQSFEEGGGSSTSAGMLTFVAGAGEWDRLRIV